MRGIDKKARLASSGVTLTPQQAYPTSVLGGEESGVQPTLASTTLATTNEEIGANASPEAQAALSRLLPAPLDKKGREKTLQRPYPVWPMQDIDNMLEPLFEMQSNIVPDNTGNANAMATAKAEGIKIRDFSRTLNNAKLTKMKHNEYTNSAIPEIFEARKMALEYHYMRILFHHGIFDLPSSRLTVDAVDRLCTIGYISDDSDFVIGRAMLGRGAFRRKYQQTGTPMPDGKVLGPRANWTISKNSVPPTLDEILEFAAEMEEHRFTSDFEWERGCKRSKQYHLPSALRPRLTQEWIEHCVKEHGKYGLKKLGTGDAAARKLIWKPDPTYIPPRNFEEFLSKRVTVPLSVLLDGWRGERAIAAHEPINVPSSSTLATVTLPPSALSPPSDPQHSTTSKGKTRASSNEDTSDDMDSESWIQPGPSSISGLPSAERVQRLPLSSAMPNSKPMMSAKAQGKKRAREDESESESSGEAEDGCSPAKKQKKEREAPATSSAVNTGRARQRLARHRWMVTEAPLTDPVNGFSAKHLAYHLQQPLATIRRGGEKAGNMRAYPPSNSEDD
ncbi:hypothetical protein EW145_g4306 [Phellinidium pouzarii]|uniref:Uncharacterized protein n=1 Tax=Phellinidium pouzarii TaxID=167371 RepID=A0A4V3XCJ2_9AGAM|nr:hypothetical protein EW145_g4306 [Phellinidium pouzarii]